MGCGISNFGIENLAVPGCFTNNLHQHNVQPTNYEDADDARKQTLKKIKTRCVDSDDSMEKKEEPENEKEELEGLRKEKIEEHRQSIDQDEETELCDEREDSLMASVSPSFRVYCLDSDSENSSKKFGDGAKSENESKVCLDSDKVSTIQIDNKERKRRRFRSVLKKARPAGKKTSSFRENS
ncbi:hypothetical protein FH972_007190 [Carpinus fangiana]|uniref:Uncharacterized protein n=1 Tax=Carpinus fangiana TaxID=176857 RepID=A0A5N6QXK2_9ROSI|nr:hypothetical protein FH972_007190 [Carpinus fangiana]